MIHRPGERLLEGQSGTFIGRYRAEYADEKQLQSDGNMPALPEQESTRFRRGPMKRDFSQVAASGVAAMQADRQDGNRFEAGSVCHRLSRSRHVRAQYLHDQSAGHA